MTRAFFPALFCAVSVCASTAVAAPVKVGIQWEYRNFGAAVKLFEVKGRPRLWKTKSVKAMKDAPIAGEIAASGFTLEPGRKKRFALVVRNQTAQPLYFFASPHAVDPIEHSIGFRFKCLCINHAFKVGPGETWYRVVEFRMSRNFVGRDLTVTHTIIGIDGKRAEALLMKPLPDY